MSIKTAAELYAHAIAIEREAAERYAELARRMADQGNEELAAVFGRLAAFEREHLEALERRTAGVALPALKTDCSRLAAGSPETVAHALVSRHITPRQALDIALDGEMRARAFFARVQRLARDPALRALAREMAAEEDQHIALLEHARACAHNPFADWASVFEGPAAVQR